MDRPQALQAGAIVDGAALAALSIASFGLFATVAENYVFSETGPNPWLMDFNLQNASWFNHVVALLWNLNQAVLRPLFPRALFSLLPDQDPFALTYFVLLLASLGVLLRRRGSGRAFFDCLLVGFSILVVYELGLTVVSIGYLDMHVTNAQVGWGLAWFTNLDLLWTSALLTGVLVVMRPRLLRHLSNAGRPT